MWWLININIRGDPYFTSTDVDERDRAQTAVELMVPKGEHRSHE